MPRKAIPIFRSSYVIDKSFYLTSGMEKLLRRVIGNREEGENICPAADASQN
jgi:hypothetical protein